MGRRTEMLVALLEGIEVLEWFHEPPEEIARHFMAWVCNVETALEGAGMETEAGLWKDASSKIRFCADETGFVAHMKSMKSILLGFLDRMEGGQVSEPLFDMEIVAETSTYIHRVAAQANGCYERGWYDACMVMIRRLLETLIIECFECHGISETIKNSDGNYPFLSEMVTRFLSDTAWHISRNTKASLARLKQFKDVANMAAHNRRFITNRHDVDSMKQDVRICVQELVYIAGARKPGQGAGTVALP